MGVTAIWGEEPERKGRKGKTDQVDSPLVGDGDCLRALLVAVAGVFWRRQRAA
jgi:hypothetical protein